MKRTLEKYILEDLPQKIVLMNRKGKHRREGQRQGIPTYGNIYLTQ